MSVVREANHGPLRAPAAPLRAALANRSRDSLSSAPSRVRIPSLRGCNKKGPHAGALLPLKLAESWGFEPQIPF